MSKERDVLQKNEITCLSQYLRNAYYTSDTEVEDDFDVPFGGTMTESIGAWPEFILRGTFCKRSSKGLCSPCFYSRFPLSQQNRSDYLEMISKQLSYVTDNFERLVVKCQYGQLSSMHECVSLVVTPTGSFFDNFEFPIDIRLDMEQRLAEIAKQQHIDIHLHIESHCEDFINYDLTDGKSIAEIALLKELNTRVILGFESVDEYSRNVLYNKNLELSDFERAIEKLRQAGLTPGAFVFAGLFGYNDLQTRNDVHNTISYLLKKEIFPVLMFQNAQPYTITDVLLKKEAVTLLEPLTVACIIIDAISLLQSQSSYWLIADPIGGPPEPECHIFKKSKHTCSACAKTIYNALVELRVTRCYDLFFHAFERIKKCGCYEKYKDHLRTLSENKESAQETVDTLLHICHCEIPSYLALMED